MGKSEPVSTIKAGASSACAVPAAKNIALKRSFIPSHRFMNWVDLQIGKKHPTCPNDERCYDFPLNTAFAMSVLAPTLGVASRMTAFSVSIRSLVAQAKKACPL
jgi:hypothetical protein